MNKAPSFRTKLWLCFVLFAAFIFSILWLLQTVFLQQLYNRMLAASTRRAAQEIAASSSEETFTDLIDRLSQENSLLVYITDSSGTIYYHSDSYQSYYSDAEENPYHSDEPMGWQIGIYRNLPDGYDTFLDTILASEDGTAEYETDTKYIFGSVIRLSDGQPAILYASASLEPVGAAVSILKIQLIWVTGLSLLIAFLLSWFLAKRFSKPVHQLVLQAEQLADGTSRPIETKGFCRELDALSDSLTRTAVKLDEAEHAQQDLLSNISHDLRTPLTMIRGYAEMVRDVSWNNEALRTADTGIIIREADRLTDLVNQILEYSRLQEERIVPVFRSADLSALSVQVCRQFRPLAEKEGIAIEEHISPACMVNGDPDLLKRLIFNLIDNALKHAGTEKKITVSVFQEELVILEVRDYGEGISEEELPHIFEKYYSTRSKSGPVSGLGLAIVKQIADLHSALCTAESTPGQGSCFRISLKPVSEASEGFCREK
ncbi:MAG: sensor histidine kinase [Bulleidia sp.]